ncbi:MAG: hypothetical protein NTZ28_08825, partial [Nitrospirae bacterium]|nr:hypothetical protein [Nitrospirota bacterium]
RCGHANVNSIIPVYGCLSLAQACAQPEVLLDFSHDSGGSAEAIHRGCCGHSTTDHHVLIGYHPNLSLASPSGV